MGVQKLEESWEETSFVYILLLEGGAFSFDLEGVLDECSSLSSDLQVSVRVRKIYQTRDLHGDS